MNGGVDLFLASVMGFHQADVSAMAIAADTMRFSGGRRFRLDEKVFDTDFPVVESFAPVTGAVVVHERFSWRAQCWDHPRRVAAGEQRHSDEPFLRTWFIVTDLIGWSSGIV